MRLGLVVGLLLLSCAGFGAAQVIIRVGGGNCGGFGCDFGQFGLDEAINASQSGDTILMYGQIFVNPDTPTPGGFADTIFTVNKSIGIAGIAPSSIQIIAPGTKGMNLFTLSAPNIEMAGFTINRQVVSGADNQPDVATIRLRSFFNGTSFPVHDIALGGVFMTTQQPFGGVDVLFENGTYSNIAVEDGSFTATTGVRINETAQITNVDIRRNQFLWAAYDNFSPFKSRASVDLRLNFWRPCPYRDAQHILPALGVQPEDDWLPYCVTQDAANCDTPGPIATPQGAGLQGWLSIQDALTSGHSDPLPVYVTAPYFALNISQIIYRRIILSSLVGSGCAEACYANGTYPLVEVRNNSAATIGFTVLGDLMSINNLQFELQQQTRLALYRRVTPYDQATFTLARGPLAFMSEAFNGVPAMDAALQSALTTNYSSQFMVRPGGDMDLLNLQISGGQQALLFWGPNQVAVETERECRLSDVLFCEQTEFGLYFAGPTFTATLESCYFGNSSSSTGLLAEKMSDMSVLRAQLIGLDTGLALSEMTDCNLDCNACIEMEQFCISVVTDSSGNTANWNTFAVPNSKRFMRNPDSGTTLSLSGNIELGQVTPLQRVFQQFSSPNFPYQFQGSPMFTSMQDVLAVHDTNSSTAASQSAARSLFVKSTYLPYVNLECFNYRDVLSSVYSAYSNVRPGCSIHKVEWDPFDNTTLPCSQLQPIVQAIPEDSWKQSGSVEVSGPDCLGQAQNKSQSLRFAIGTASMRDAFVCVGCDGDFTPFQNKTCDFELGTFQEAMEQVRISQLQDATLFVNGICHVFDEEIDVQGLTIEGCGTAILSPTQGPSTLPSVELEASFQLHITVNFTTIENIIFSIAGDNTTYASDYCVIFIDGELLPIFNTTLFNNSFLQPGVDQVCTLMDTNTQVRRNSFQDGRRGVKMSADSNAVVPHVSGVNVYEENEFQEGAIHLFYSFLMPIRRPTQPYSRLQVLDNSFVNPGDVGLDVLGINGRRSRQDLLFLRNRYTNPTPDPAACMEGNTDPTICCEEDKGCDSFAQRFVDSEDALFDNERYFGGAVMQMAGRNVLIQNSKWRDRSGVTVGNTDIALLQNPFSPENVTMDNVEFEAQATLVCNLGRSFNPRTGQESALRVTNTIINGQNIGVVKDDCEQTLVGVMTTSCVDRAGNTIFSARNTAPFAADEFIEPTTRVRTNCTPPFVFIPSQQGGTGTCNCEYLPDDQFIKTVPFIPIVSGARVRRQEEEVNSEVRNCPTGQIHNPNNRSECISASPTPTPTATPTATPTPTPKTTTTKTKHHSSSSSSSSSSDLHHLWWLWIVLGVVILLVILGVVIWVCVAWNRRGKKEKAEEEETQLTTFSNPPSQPPPLVRRSNTFGDSLRFTPSESRPSGDWSF